MHFVAGEVRKPPRKVIGSFIAAIIRSMAAWRSAARASAGYGDISATGLPRLVMTTCSPGFYSRENLGKALIGLAGGDASHRMLKVVRVVHQLAGPL